jgi:hypothetical protein
MVKKPVNQMLVSTNEPIGTADDVPSPDGLGLLEPQFDAWPDSRFQPDLPVSTTGQAVFIDAAVDHGLLLRDLARLAAGDPQANPQGVALGDGTGNGLGLAPLPEDAYSDALLGIAASPDVRRLLGLDPRSVGHK